MHGWRYVDVEKSAWSAVFLVVASGGFNIYGGWGTIRSRCFSGSVAALKKRLSSSFASFTSLIFCFVLFVREIDVAIFVPLVGWKDSGEVYVLLNRLAGPLLRRLSSSVRARAEKLNKKNLQRFSAR